MRRIKEAGAGCLVLLVIAGCAKNPMQGRYMGSQKYVSVEDARAKNAPMAKTPAILPQTYFAAGRLFESQGQLAKAIEQYRKAIATNHKFVAAYHRLGRTLSRAGQHDEAVAALEHAVELRPDIARLHNDYGYELMYLARWDESETELRTAIATQPEFIRAHINLGLVLSRTDRFQEALDTFREVLPEADARYNLGLLYRGQKLYAEAAREFEEVLGIDPEFSAAQLQLDQLKEQLDTVAVTEERQVPVRKENEAVEQEDVRVADAPAQPEVRVTERQPEPEVRIAETRTEPEVRVSTRASSPESSSNRSVRTGALVPQPSSGQLANAPAIKVEPRSAPAVKERPEPKVRLSMRETSPQPSEVMPARTGSLLPKPSSRRSANASGTKVEARPSTTVALEPEAAPVIPEEQGTLFGALVANDYKIDPSWLKRDLQAAYARQDRKQRRVGKVQPRSGDEERVARKPAASPKPVAAEGRHPNPVFELAAAYGPPVDATSTSEKPIHTEVAEQDARPRDWRSLFFGLERMTSVIANDEHCYRDEVERFVENEETESHEATPARHDNDESRPTAPILAAPTMSGSR